MTDEPSELVEAPPKPSKAPIIALVVAAMLLAIVGIVVWPLSADWDAGDAARVQGLAALGTLLASLVLAGLTAWYVYVTKHLATSSDQQIDVAQKAVKAAKDANKIANLAIAAQRDAAEKQLAHATRALWASTTPIVTAENIDQRFVPPAPVNQVLPANKLSTTTIDLRLRFEVVNHGPGPAIVSVEEAVPGVWHDSAHFSTAGGAQVMQDPMGLARVLNENEKWDIFWRYDGSIGALRNLSQNGLRFTFHSHGTTTPVQDTHSWPLVHATGLTDRPDGAIHVAPLILAMNRLATDERIYEGQP
jgi:hypothetical protein